MCIGRQTEGPKLYAVRVGAVVINHNSVNVGKKTGTDTQTEEQTDTRPLVYATQAANEINLSVSLTHTFA